MIAVRQNSKGWIEYDIIIVFPDGTKYRERRRSPMATIAATERWAAQREAHLHREGPPKPVVVVSATPSLAEFAERWLVDHAVANRHKPAGIAHKRQVIGSHLSELASKPLDQITPADIASLKGRLTAKGLAPKTVNNVLVVLSRLLRSAEEWEIIPKAPSVKLVKASKKSMPFHSYERYDKLVVGAMKVSQYSLALVLLAGDAGLRRGELLALEWRDIDLERGIISVERSLSHGHLGTTKGNTSRVVVMTQMLHRVLSSLPRIVKRVFPQASVKNFRRLILQAEEAAGLEPEGQLHILRHTYASHAIAQGVPLYAVQTALGHKDPNTTQGYVHLTVEALRPIAKSIDDRRSSWRGRGDNSEGVLFYREKVAPQPGLEPESDVKTNTPN